MKNALPSSLLRFLALLLFFPADLTAQGQRYYVDGQASGQLTGQSWTDAFRDLHDALALALPGDEVWVAKGVYQPAATDRTARYQLPSGVRLYGGFTGAEMLLEERPPAGQATVLSGDIGMVGDSSDNSYTLLYLRYPDVQTLVDGFTFRDALANDPNASVGTVGAAGAALYILGEDSIAYPTIRNSRFEHNTAQSHGGAVFINGSGSGSVAPLFRDCQFRYNQAGLNGGAVYRDGASWWERPADLDHCTFEHNRAVRGGCFYLADAERSDTLQIVASNFYRNFAEQQADVMALGRARQVGASTVRIIQCDLSENLNKGIFSTDVFSTDGSLDMQIDSCTIYNNVSTGIPVIRLSLFGKIRCDISNCFLSTDLLGGINSQQYIIAVEEISDLQDNALFIHHSLFQKCGVLLSCNAKSLINKSIFNKNISCEIISTSGYCIKNTVFNKIASLQLQNGRHIFIENSIFFKNYMQPDVSIVPNDSIATISNCIFWPLTDHVDFFYDKFQFLFSVLPVQANNCLFTDTLYSKGYLDGGTDPITGPGVQIGPDPLFLDTLHGDFHLHPCSPAWNAGDNASTLAQGLTTDLDGRPRIVDGQVDIGAYEVQPLRSTGPAMVQAACFSRPEGAVQWDLQNGCAPYAYQWASGGTTGSTTSGLAPGPYAFTITDSRGRTLLQNADVPASAPELTLSGDTLLCPASTDGSLMALVSALLPVTYQWSTGSSSGSIDHLSVGQYSATLTDAIGCRDTATAVITSSPLPIVTAQIGKASSVTTADGNIQVTVESGQPPYTYTWTEVPSASPTIAGLLSGTYHLLVTDGAGCATPFQYEVGATSATTAPEPLVAGSVQPNPARAQVLLRFGDSMTWQLFSVTGVEVLRVEGQSVGGTLSVDLSGLPAGLYFYAFSRDSRMLSQDRLFILGE